LLWPRDGATSAVPVTSGICVPASAMRRAEAAALAVGAAGAVVVLLTLCTLSCDARPVAFSFACCGLLFLDWPLPVALLLHCMNCTTGDTTRHSGSRDTVLEAHVT
jgi:hypothetical protein